MSSASTIEELYMPYRYKTNFYRIPVMGEGDILTEEQEWVQMSTIDNLLRAATFGCTKAYLEDGTYSIEWDDRHMECHLVIKPSKSGGYSLMGIINCRLFMSMVDVRVGTLYKDSEYYVYVEYDNGLETDAQCFSVRAYPTKQTEDSRRMALCIVNTSGEGTIDTDVNKVYAKNILAHTMDSTNPHGRHQTQDELDVIESLTVKGYNVNGVMYATALTAGDGNDVNVTFKGEPAFVVVYPEELGAGEIAWEITGNTVRILNSGRAGIRLNIRADAK